MFYMTMINMTIVMEDIVANDIYNYVIFVISGK